MFAGMRSDTRGISCTVRAPSGGDGADGFVMGDEAKTVRPVEPRLVDEQVLVELEQFEDHIGQLLT